MKKLAELRREVELTKCPHCGEPLDLEPCSGRHSRLQEQRIAELVAALKGMFKAADEIAIEFIQKKRATDWAIVNDAYLEGSKQIRKGS